tara:strand:+ start:2226 stop:2426 length:201 start_codon:yes stop_codon:yes gene_type:complete
MLKVTRKSQMSGITRTLELNTTSDQMAAYEAKRSLLIQDAFPQLTADEREFIKTGVTAEEWEELFG